MKRTIITISREHCTGGLDIARKVAENMGIPFYDKELITMAAKESGLSEESIAAVEKRHSTSLLYSLYTMGGELPLNDQVFLIQSRIITDIASKGPCVIVGRCADYVLDEFPNCLRVFVMAPLEERVRRAREEYHVETVHMENYVTRQDRYRASYYNHFVGKKWGDMGNYDLCINSHIGIENAVQAIKTAALAMEGDLR